MNIVQIKNKLGMMIMPKIIEDVEEKILLEAKDLLINSNYTTFTIRALSKKSGVSIGTIYNYFTNKRNLINAVFLSDWNKALERLKNINTNCSTLEEKLFQIYLEIDNFLKIYLSIFLEISSLESSIGHQPYLKSLYSLVDEILIFEKMKGTITTSLSNEKLCKFIINNLILLSTDKTLNFKDLYLLIKF